MTDYTAPDLTGIPEDEKVDVCWDWICRTYATRELRADAVIQFFDQCWESENPEAWAVAVKVKQRAREQRVLR